MPKLNMSNAARLAEDPRVAEAKRLLLEALAEHQAALSGPKPPDPALAAEYAGSIAAFEEMRGGSLFFPYLGSGLGKGALVELADGSVKYDFITGIGVHYFGHSHPDLVSASVDAALSDTVMQGNLQQTALSVEVVKLLLEGANRRGASLAHCFLTTSGAMANENALKILFQKRSGAGPCSSLRLLAFEGCFMGRTLALSQVTDKAAYRVGLPATLNLDYVPFFDAADPEGSSRRAVSVLRKHLARYPGQYAAMCMELVLGEGGYYPGNRDFFLDLIGVLKQHGIAVFMDEIQTFGRTQELFAFQYFGLDEFVDAVSIGKLSQVCATLIRGEFKPAPGLISQTFTSTTSALTAARVIVERLMRGDFLGPDGRIMRFHRYFTDKLKSLEAQRPELLAGPYGMGAMIAFTPLGGDPEKVKQLLQVLFEAGVIAFSAGTHPARIRFLMPVGALETADIDAVYAIVEKALLDLGNLPKGN